MLPLQFLLAKEMLSRLLSYQKCSSRERREVASAFAKLIGLYSLNTDYPQGLHYTFKQIQKSFHGYLQWQLLSKSSQTAKQNAWGHSVVASWQSQAATSYHSFSWSAKCVCTKTASPPTCPQTQHILKMLQVHERKDKRSEIKWNADIERAF